MGRFHESMDSYLNDETKYACKFQKPRTPALTGVLGFFMGARFFPRRVMGRTQEETS